MAGKYASVIHKLPRHLGTDPGHQVKVDAVKESMRNDPEFDRTSLGLARTYGDLRAIREPLKDVCSTLQVQIDALEQMIALNFEDADIPSVTYNVLMLTDEAIEKTVNECRLYLQRARLARAAAENVRVQSEPYAKVYDPDKYKQWAIARGMENRFQMLWPVTNALVKEMVLNSEPEPDGVEAKRLDKIVLSKK